MTIDWDDIKERVIWAGTITLIAAGLWVAYKRPPREVADRFSYVRIVTRTECTSRSDKGNCTSYRTWTEPQTVYVAVSSDHAQCEVGMYTYFVMRKGTMLKCWQLFGWHGGELSDEQINRKVGAW